jgi:O-antigen ligase
VDNPGFLNGFQANRNAEVDVLLIAALAAATLTRQVAPRGSGPPFAAGAGACIVLLLGAVLTGSRTGIALAVPVVAIIAMTLDDRLRGTRALALLAGIALAPAVVLGLALATHNQPLLSVAARFTFARDVRIDLWRDTWSAIVRFWPWGSGVGTFVPAFLPSERLVVVDPTLPVRAHNDYLEFLLEGGATAGVILLAALAVVALGVRLARARAQAGERPFLLFGISAMGVIGAHSFVDYPLRSMALACLGATACGIVLGLAAEPRPNGSKGLIPSVDI